MPYPFPHDGRGRCSGEHPCGSATQGRGAEGTAPPRRGDVPGGRAGLLHPLDRAVVHRQPRGGRLRGAVGAVDPLGRRVLDGRGARAMSGLDVLLAVAGGVVTVMVIAGMILITPRGEVDLRETAPESQGEQLSRVGGAELAGE